MNARQRAGRAGQAEKALWLRLLLGAPRCVPASRLRPPRHRAVPRPGAAARGRQRPRGAGSALCAAGSRVGLRPCRGWG